MFVGTRLQTNNINEYYDIYLDGCKLVRVEEEKFLGIKKDKTKHGRNKLIMYANGVQEILVFQIRLNDFCLNKS